MHSTKRRYCFQLRNYYEMKMIYRSLNNNNNRKEKSDKNILNVQFFKINLKNQLHIMWTHNSHASHLCNSHGNDETAL